MPLALQVVIAGREELESTADEFDEASALAGVHQTVEVDKGHADPQLWTTGEVLPMHDGEGSDARLADGCLDTGFASGVMALGLSLLLVEQFHRSHLLE